jgi:hypothetical protein
MSDKLGIGILLSPDDISHHSQSSVLMPIAEDSKKKNSIHRRSKDDASERALREAQHLLRILQSEGMLSHEYTVGGKTQVVKRLGSPVVVTTTTDETIFEDDSTRFLALRVSESPSKILAERVEQPANEVWQEAFRLLRARASRPFSFPEWLDFVAEQLPRDEVRVQRDWKRFLGLLQAAALCRPQSGSTTKASFADYCVVHRIVNSAFTATTHAVNENEIAIQRAARKLTLETGQPTTIKQIRDQLEWANGVTYKYVRLAVQHGLLNYEGGSRENNVKRVLPSDRSAKDFLPNPKIVLEHCGRQGETHYVDPINGQTKRLSGMLP